MDKKKPGTTSEFLDRLNEALSGVPAESREELEADLREEGVNVERVVAGVLRLVDEALARESWQERARRERAAALERMKERHRSRLEPGILRQRVSEFRAGTQFRKFEKATQKDLESLLDDEDVVEQLEKVDRQPDEEK